MAKRLYIKWKWFVFPSHYESTCRKVKYLYYEKWFTLHQIMRLLGYSDAWIIHKYKEMLDCKNAGRRQTKPRY